MVLGKRMKRIGACLLAVLALSVFLTGTAAAEEVQVTNVILNDGFDGWDVGGGYGWNSDNSLRVAKVNGQNQLMTPDYLGEDVNWVLVADKMGEQAGGLSLVPSQYPRNWQVSFDAYFPSGVLGSVKFYLQGLFKDSPTEWTIVSFDKGTTHGDTVDGAYNAVYVQYQGQVVAANYDAAMGGLAAEMHDGDPAAGNTGYDAWLTCTLRKNGPTLEYLVNGTPVMTMDAQNVTAPQLTNLNTWISTQQTGILLDNIRLEEIEPSVLEEIPVTDVTLSANRIQLAKGETATIKAVLTPADAIAGEYVWTVNGEPQAEAGDTLLFANDTPGEYEIVCEVDGVKSRARTILVTEETAAPSGGQSQNPSGTDETGSETPAWLIPVIAAVACVAVAAVAAFLIWKKRKAAK